MNPPSRASPTSQGSPRLRLLYEAAAVREGVERVARAVREKYQGEELTVLVILRGGMIFGADLVRAIDLPLRIDTVRVSAYRGEDRVAGDVLWHLDPTLDLKGRQVLIVDDILDTGRTLEQVKSEVQRLGAATVEAAVLLDKPARRSVPIQADFVGFTVPNVWVVGYGLDHDEKYRNLPYLAALEIRDGGPPPQGQG